MDEIFSLQSKIETLFSNSEYKSAGKKSVKESEIFSANLIDESDQQINLDTKELAGSIERVLNASQNTVKFGVDASGDSSGIKFKIVNEETGEILREFPKEDIRKLREIVAKQAEVGVLVDTIA